MTYTPPNPPLITLAVILFNEEEVIERFIRSFADAVDQMVFCFARGSTPPDSTGSVINRVCTELNIPVACITYHNKLDCSGVDDFGAARQQAWSCAALTGARYIMWADADDVLAQGAAETLSQAATDGTHDVFVCPYIVRGSANPKQIVMRERLVRNDDCSQWQFTVHEQLKFSRPVTYRVLSDAAFKHEPSSTKTGSSLRNVTLLERQIEEVSRNYFYLHQENFEQGNVALAKMYGRAALNSVGLDPLLRYEILLMLAQCEPGQDARRMAAEAFDILPDRREALALLANYALLDGAYDRANQLARIMMSIVLPRKSYWCLNREWYGWKGSELYLQTLRLVGGDVDSFEKRMHGDQGPVFSIIHATLGRPAKALAVREMWLSRAKNPEKVEYIFGLHEGDEESIRLLKGFRHSKVEQGCGCPTNYDQASTLARGKVIIQAQDDCYPPIGWDDIFLERLGGDLDMPAFLAVGDGQRKDKLCVNSIMTRAHMELMAMNEDGRGNGFMHRGYPGVFADTDNSYRAYAADAAGISKVVEARDIIIYHDHPAFNQQVPWDKTYEIENSPECNRVGKELFAQRNPNAEHDGLLT